ncbi:hypothetical protein SAMD00019534_003970 [Acytostelium subglobosum LB1]|uniref:hypothetical protein n=1 Tax=Acytostelium subglobosum LB1 TaxID=1410327 RepID=UPI00064482BF|nr:hypothetical protein SAMD00019534_003970 [Acytostelium subglobosum LB1]GAM17222.1 hypothetical protein SAMD00019534_003970 [Acytostelium subglobosum LB1]|eukprot:XP_012759284.1 hypothetical protein SAMD00019534_003970 [Acytostelium subglobosum LB1]
MNSGYDSLRGSSRSSRDSHRSPAVNSNTSASIFSPIDSLTNLFRSNNNLVPPLNTSQQHQPHSPLSSPNSSFGHIQAPHSPRGGSFNASANNASSSSPHSSTKYNNDNYANLLAASNRTDFVIFSEFSEQTGPVALNVIPEHVPLYEGFDISKYVVKIMSVDFQNKTNDLRTYTKDSQMFFTLTSIEPSQELYAYVHHFSLFDINARGYVRPLVISYVTRDANKIIKSFDRFLAKFTSIVNFLKSKNHVMFETEFRQRMCDLDYSLKYYKSDEAAGLTDREREMNITIVSDSKYELRGIEALFERERSSRVIVASSTTNGVDGSAGPDRDRDRDSSLSSSGQVYRRKKQHSGLKIKKHGALPHCLESSFGMVYINDIAPTCSEPKLLDSLNKTSHLDKPLREIPELCCQDIFDKFISKLEKCHSYFSKSSIQLEFDHIDSQSLFPTSTLLSIGQTSILNFYFKEDDVNNKQHYPRSQRRDIKPKNHRSKIQLDSSSGSESSSYLSVFSYGSINDALEELSLSPSDYLKLSNNNFINNYTSNSQTQSPAAPTAHQNGVVGPASQHSNSPTTTTTTTTTNNNGNNTQTSTNEQIPTITTTQPMVPINEIKLETFSKYLWGIKPHYGHGLLRMATKYIWMRHAIYSLLKGRPVLVLASQDKYQLMIDMVIALSIFVIGSRQNNSRDPIDLHRDNPITLADLSWLKLAGVPKTPHFKIPTNVNCYISKIDLDTEEYTGPSYQQTPGLIDEMLGLKRQWVDNEGVYLSHVLNTFFELSIKSFSYYHLCCAHSHPLRSDCHPFISSLIGAIAPLSYSTSELPSLTHSGISMTPPDADRPASDLKSSTFTLRKRPPIMPIKFRSMSESQLTPPECGQAVDGLSATLKSSQNSNSNSASDTSNSNSMSSPLAQTAIKSSLGVPAIVANGKRSSLDSFSCCPKTLFKRWELSAHDQTIIEFLAEVIKEQQYFELYTAKGQDIAPIIKLDFSPVVHLKNKR